MYVLLKVFMQQEDAIIRPGATIGTNLFSNSRLPKR